MKARIPVPNRPDSTASSVIVSYDVQPNGSTVLIVGKKEPNKPIKIINAFQGDRATDIWDILTKPESKAEVPNDQT